MMQERLFCYKSGTLCEIFGYYSKGTRLLNDSEVWFFHIVRKYQKCCCNNKYMGNVGVQ